MTLFSVSDGCWVMLAQRYPAKYRTPLSEPKYTAAALPPTTVKASATATKPEARYRFMTASCCVTV
jgi:hypothetical protein